MFQIAFYHIENSYIDRKEYQSINNHLRYNGYVEGKPNLSKKALFLSLAIFNNLSYEIISI